MEKRSKIILWIWNILLFVTIVLCLSCGSPSTTNENHVKNDTLLQYNYNQYNNHDTWDEIDKVLKFEYSGHQYIQFNLHEIYGISTSVVHDPDCQCHQINR